MLQSLPLTEQDIAALTPIMAAAFDDDSKIHTGVEHDGPRGYDDGSLLLRQLADPALTCRKVLLDGSVIGAWTVRQQAAQCTLELFFLDPALHNQGLGQQVWQQIEGPSRRRRSGFWKRRTTRPATTTSTPKSAAFSLSKPSATPTAGGPFCSGSCAVPRAFLSSG